MAGKGPDPLVLADMVWSPSGRWLAIAAEDGGNEGYPQLWLVVSDALDPSSFRRFPLNTGGILKFFGDWKR